MAVGSGFSKRGTSAQEDNTRLTVYRPNRLTVYWQNRPTVY